MADRSEGDEVRAALSVATGEGGARATIVAVRGSTDRRPGARLVVPADENEPVVGNLSGGCVEGEVVAAAHAVLASGRPRLLHLDLAADDDVWGWGLGCAGAVEVLVEPAAGAASLVTAMAVVRETRQSVVVVTALDGAAAGGRLVVHHGGRREGSLEVDGAASLAAASLADGRPPSVRVTRAGRLFVEVLDPPVRLVVCGGGADVDPLVELAARLGWLVETVGDRSPRPAVDGRTAVVVMSHHFGRDKDYLRSWLDAPLAYLGVLGPRTRFERLVAQLRGEGVAAGPAAVARVHAPAGLDLGAEGPDEIALAIVSEILAVHKGNSAGSLRERPGPVHARSGRSERDEASPGIETAEVVGIGGHDRLLAGPGADHEVGDGVQEPSA
ncbi:MAG: XdhC family protein [Acidimicrobiales bacterium]